MNNTRTYSACFTAISANQSQNLRIKSRSKRQSLQAITKMQSWKLRRNEKRSKKLSRPPAMVDRLG